MTGRIKQVTSHKNLNAHLIMSSLRIACRLSLQESCAPKITPTKGKKAAARIVTPPEKENVPPAAAPRKETIEPPLAMWWRTATVPSLWCLRRWEWALSCWGNDLNPTMGIGLSNFMVDCWRSFHLFH
jgi:hypothetical protein